MLSLIAFDQTNPSQSTLAAQIKLVNWQKPDKYQNVDNKLESFYNYKCSDRSDRSVTSLIPVL